MKVSGINFSTKYTTGSVISRKNTVRQVREKIFDKVIKNYDSAYIRDTSAKTNQQKYMPLEVVKKLIKDSLPEKLKLNVKNLPKEGAKYGGCLKSHVRDNDFLVSYYRMELPAKKNALYVANVPILMHEVTHLLDYAINPQHVKTLENLVNNGLVDDFSELYSNFYYTPDLLPKFKVAIKTKKLLKDLSIEEKLLILKRLGLELQTEINAYGCMERYTNILRDLGMCKIQYNKKVYNSYKFEKKLKLVEKLRYKIISKERKKIAENISALQKLSKK